MKYTIFICLLVIFCFYPCYGEDADKVNNDTNTIIDMDKAKNVRDEEPPVEVNEDPEPAEDDIDSLFEESKESELKDDDIDSLFEEGGESEAEEEHNEADDKEGDIISDVLKKDDFTLNAQFKFYIGYSPGWDRFFWDMEEETHLEYLDSAVMKMQSIFTLNFQLSPELRVLQKYTLSFPDFETKVTEFFCDYIILDKLFLRFGRQKLTWGISRNFPFTNLPARLPDDYDNSDIDGADSFAVKLNFPIGIGGIEGLAFTREGYFPGEDLPAMEDVGFGGTFNLALPVFDLTLGTFYHKALNYRSYCSMSFTLFDRLEVYTEGLLAIDLDALESGEENPLDNPVDGGVNGGFYIDFFSGKLEINGEYFFNGEESQLELKGSLYPLFYGHNIAGNISFKTYNEKLRLFAQYRYNFNGDSHLLIPGMTLDILPHFSLLFTIPAVFGSLDGGYYTENPDTEQRPISFVLALLISGKK